MTRGAGRGGQGADTGTGTGVGTDTGTGAGTESARGASPEEADRGRVERLRQEAAGLRQALKTYPIIDMARGVVMATAPCTKEEAWQILVEISQSTNVKLREVARYILDGVTGEPMPPPIRQALRAALERIRAGRR